MKDEYAAFSRFYDLWASKMVDDVAFYVERARDSPEPILELGAGSGRVAVAIAAGGKRVVAVDASPAMIALGRERAAAAGVSDRITWVQARMQGFVADPPVGLVIIPFRSFLHLLETEDQLSTLRAIGASLVSGGRVILNFFQPDPVLQVRHDGERVLDGEFTDDAGRRCLLWRTGTYEVTTQRLHARATCERLEGERVVAVEEAEFSLRFVYRYEFEHLLARAGLEVEALYGWFDERPFTEECREMIWVARKP